MWKDYKEKSIAISKSDLDHVWHSKPKIEDYMDPKKLIIDIDNLISRTCKVYYGIPEQFISDELVEEVAKEIVKKYKTLTFDDLTHAYERWNMERKDNWKNVTKQELIAPIQAWSNYQQKIKEDFNCYKRQIQEEDERQAAAEAFRKESIEFYNECVDNLEWTGTIFQASAIRMDLNKHFSAEIKKELRDQAMETYQRTQEAYNDATRRGIRLGMDNIGYSAKRIYSELLVKEGIKNGVKI